MIGWLIKKLVDGVITDDLFERIETHLKEVASQ